MYKIPYTFTNKSKLLFYIMIMVLGLLRLTVIFQMKIYNLDGYQVYLLPTLIYYFVLFTLLTCVFFGYKFFYTEYDDKMVIYHNCLMKKSISMNFDQIRYARFSSRGIHLYKECSPTKEDRADLFIPFFRLGIIQAIPVNSFFERLISMKSISIDKTFKILPGYSKPWSLVSMVYALLAICLLIICMEPLYTVIVLFQSFS